MGQVDLINPIKVQQMWRLLFLLEIMIYTLYGLTYIATFILYAV